MRRPEGTTLDDARSLPSTTTERSPAAPAFDAIGAVTRAFEAGGTRGRCAGELRLLSAILLEAIHSFSKGFEPRRASDRPGTRAYIERQAETWLFANDRASCFSFLNVCDALGLDPAYVRRKLRDLESRRERRRRQVVLRSV